MDLKNVIGPGGKDMRITDREIIRTPTDDGEHWELRGSPAAIRKALAGKIQDQASKGKWVRNDKGEPITLDNLDQMLQGATEEVRNPSVLRRIDFDYLWTWRFFAKLALSAGHYLFGQEFALKTSRRTKKNDEFADCGRGRAFGHRYLPGDTFPATPVCAVQDQRPPYDLRKPRAAQVPDVQSLWLA
jgi:hypothetical protein